VYAKSGSAEISDSTVSGWVGSGVVATDTVTLENNTGTEHWPSLEVVLPAHTIYVQDSLATSDAIFPDVSTAWYDWDHVIYWEDPLMPYDSVVITFELFIETTAPMGHELVVTAYPWYFGDTPVSVTTTVAYPVFLPIAAKP
jgi:hypothetical protein